MKTGDCIIDDNRDKILIDFYMLLSIPTTLIIIAFILGYLIGSAK